MKTLTFDCTFLSDVILNASSATAGTNEVLDYIPGVKFLGIMAKKHYESIEADTDSILNVFYSGNIRFGDAHLLCDGKRSLKMPLDFFEGKNKEEDGKIWIRHHLTEEDEEKQKGKIQLKQKRSGYFLPSEKKTVSANSDYSLKSAYDADYRRSKDKQMYGYKSIKKGSVWQFSVEIDDAANDFEAQIKTALIGERSLGKSRSAQYGRVKICIVSENPESNYKTSAKDLKANTEIVLYAESNLCFVDEYGQFTVTPSAQQLGFSDSAKIDWSKSQVRHRFYAPWIVKRSARDADRWIIEKGSVIIVHSEVEENVDLSKGVGIFRAEGYGKVLVNPDFLTVNNIKLTDGKLTTKNYKIPNSSKDAKVKALLDFRREKFNPDNVISKTVAEFIRDHEGEFKNISSSQWGQVRNIAQNVNETNVLDVLLFNKDVGFFYTAKRKNEWSRKVEKLKSKLDTINTFEDKKSFLILLSSEMAKTVKTNTKDVE
jgi:hypothetical protein